MQSIKFKPMIWVGNDVVDFKGIYIDVADNDMEISKYLKAPLSAPLLAGRTSHFVKNYYQLSYNFIAAQRRGASQLIYRVYRWVGAGF
ncbi:hypothetical protein QUA00_28470 [Microcoleus sp. T2B6]|uniref:hypothetical protein n=1 Tax=Microcoleus sp. T2B6 TaxID=3055424 RepID=UPI002FD08D15